METSGTFHAGLVLDGYRFIRPIGAGGFGTVWLAESEATGGFHALKIVHSSEKALERELAAVRLFRDVSRKIRSPHLIAIEHVNTHGDALFYLLPLADGGPSSDPLDPRWKPETLAERIEHMREASAWFTPKQIREIFLPVARVVAEMNAAGVVHRDIKPANILFFGGRPCMADVGLLEDDRQSLSARGTPGHVPPSWYLESSGQPDMWGLAATLYTLLSGNHPDKLGRANFRWPPQGEDSLPPDHRTEWHQWHAVVLRATEERPHERFLTLEAFVDACDYGRSLESGSTTPTHREKSRGRRVVVLGLALGVLIVTAVLGWVKYADGTLRFELPLKTANPQAIPAIQAPNGESAPISPPEVHVDLSNASQEALDSVQNFRKNIEKFNNKLIDKNLNNKNTGQNTE